MRLLIAFAIACVALTGCVAVPLEPAPVVYAAPPPVVVVPYRHHWHHHHGGRHWRRWR